MQIYAGNRKGKSTAAIGLAIRSAGAGLRVFITQFFKRKPVKVRENESAALQILKKEVIDQKGAIICIEGKPPDDWAEGAEISLRKQLSRFDAVRFITPQIDSFLLHGIWLKMLSKGITDLVVTMATFSEPET